MHSYLDACTLYGPQPEKTCLCGFANNKGADQPTHLHSLINAFFIRLLESIRSTFVTVEFSILWLVFVAEETGLSLNFSESWKTGFVTLRLICTWLSVQ